MQNLGLAFHLITKEFAVARLLEPEDLLSNDAVDARSIAIYLIELRSAVEIDRRRRNKPSFEIRTATMVGRDFNSLHRTFQVKCATDPHIINNLLPISLNPALFDIRSNEKI